MANKIKGFNMIETKKHILVRDMLFCFDGI
jgi:hypothetical protein